MEEKTAQPQEAQEVVLQYVAPAQEVISYYVAPAADQSAAEEMAAPRRRRRGKRVFLALLALLVVGLGIFAGLNSNWIFRGYYGYGEEFFEDFPYYEYAQEEEPPSMSLIEQREDIRLRYNEDHGEILTIQEVYERVNPSTVTIAAELENGRMGVGTGIIMTADGYLLTNAHVIAGARSCLVVLADGTQYDAALVGYDMEQDIAVLKVEAENLPAAEFGDSDALRVGDSVYAIGNPLGFELRGTLTDGIVSAINRDVELDGVTMTLIQTNAALNSGNSGGPLINAYGQVVGINLMKMDRQNMPIASVEGLGFAIPIAASAYMVDDLIAYGEVRGEAVMGIMVLNEEDVEKNGTPGIEIKSVDEGGSGERAGLRAGDVIVLAEGEEIHSSNDLLRIRRRFRAGDSIAMTIDRGGERIEIFVPLERAE